MQQTFLCKFARDHLMMDILLNKQVKFNAKSQIGFEVKSQLLKTSEEVRLSYKKLNESQQEAVMSACI